MVMELLSACCIGEAQRDTCRFEYFLSKSEAGCCSKENAELLGWW